MSEISVLCWNIAYDFLPQRVDFYNSFCHNSNEIAISMLTDAKRGIEGFYEHNR